MPIKPSTQHESSQRESIDQHGRVLGDRPEHASRVVAGGRRGKRKTAVELSHDDGPAAVGELNGHAPVVPVAAGQGVKGSRNDEDER